MRRKPDEWLWGEKGGRKAGFCCRSRGVTRRARTGPRGRIAAGGVEEADGTMDTVALETSPVTFCHLPSPLKGYARRG